MFEQTFKNIDDILHKDAGCGSELDYVEQTSWVLFLKYLDDLEQDKATTAELSAKAYTPIIAPEFQWNTWATPKLANGSIDHNALTGDDLSDFVNIQLFPYLKKFKTSADSADIVRIRPDVNIIDYKYLEYFLNTDLSVSQLTGNISGATRPRVNLSDVRNIEIPLPPLQEQQRIVAILDKAFEAIDQAKANAQQNLKNAKELFESYLQGVFENNGDGWEEKTLNQISENLDSKRVPITKNVRKEGSIPYYGASGIVDYVADFLFDEDLLCISEDGANLLARTYPIAFSISGKTWVNNHAHVLRFESMNSQKFVELYLNSIKLDDYVSGMAQPKLNQTMLNKIKIPYPPLKEQQVIVEKLDALSTETKQLEAIYQQKINDLDELKKSILQKAFAGELNTAVDIA